MSKLISVQSVNFKKDFLLRDNEGYTLLIAFESKMWYD